MIRLVNRPHSFLLAILTIVSAHTLFAPPRATARATPSSAPARLRAEGKAESTSPSYTPSTYKGIYSNPSEDELPSVSPAELYERFPERHFFHLARLAWSAKDYQKKSAERKKKLAQIVDDYIPNFSKKLAIQHPATHEQIIRNAIYTKYAVRGYKDVGVKMYQGPVGKALIAASFLSAPVPTAAAVGTFAALKEIVNHEFFKSRQKLFLKYSLADRIIHHNPYGDTLFVQRVEEHNDALWQMLYLMPAANLHNAAYKPNEKLPQALLVDKVKVEPTDAHKKLIGILQLRDATPPHSLLPRKGGGGGGGGGGGNNNDDDDKKDDEKKELPHKTRKTLIAFKTANGTYYYKPPQNTKNNTIIRTASIGSGGIPTFGTTNSLLPPTLPGQGIGSAFPALIRSGPKGLWQGIKNTLNNFLYGTTQSSQWHKGIAEHRARQEQFIKDNNASYHTFLERGDKPGELVETTYLIGQGDTQQKMLVHHEAADASRYKPEQVGALLGISKEPPYIEGYDNPAQKNRVLIQPDVQGFAGDPTHNKPACKKTKPKNPKPHGCPTPTPPPAPQPGCGADSHIPKDPKQQEGCPQLQPQEPPKNTGCGKPTPALPQIFFTDPSTQDQAPSPGKTLPDARDKVIPAKHYPLDPSLGGEKELADAIEKVKHIPGALTKDGPVTKLLEHGKQGAGAGELGTARGAAYEIEVANKLIKQGEKVEGIGSKKPLIKNGIIIKIIEIDVETSTKLIECKNVNWKNMNPGNLQNVKRKLLLLKDMALSNNKKLELHSKNILPDVFKNWLKKKNIIFFEG